MYNIRYIDMRVFLDGYQANTIKIIITMNILEYRIICVKLLFDRLIKTNCNKPRWLTEMLIPASPCASMRSEPVELQHSANKLELLYERNDISSEFLRTL